MKPTIEWEDGTGVRDPGLAATWARLTLEAPGPSGRPLWLSRCEVMSTGGVRDGVYGSVLPLATWLARNWWFVLAESARSDRVPNPRKDATFIPGERSWLSRHNLLAARAGMSLPDVTICRDGPWGWITCRPDPQDGDSRRQVRFTTAYDYRVPAEHLEAHLYAFVQAVVGRVGELGTDTAEVRSLAEDWSAVNQSMRTEADLCRRLARLGVDPYEPDGEFQGELAGLLAHPPVVGGEQLLDDLASATTPERVASDLSRIEEVVAANAIGPADNTALPAPANHSHRVAFQDGLDVADTVRRECGLPGEPLPALEPLLIDRCGWPTDFRRPTEWAHGSVAGLVGWSSNGALRVADVRGRREADDRFRLARAVYFWVCDRGTRRPRLVTGSYDWDQKASRACAAELLAPVSALRNRVNEVVDLDQLDELATEFNVDPRVIRHQLTNNRLAVVADL